MFWAVRKSPVLCSDRPLRNPEASPTCPTFLQGYLVLHHNFGFSRKPVPRLCGEGHERGKPPCEFRGGSSLSLRWSGKNPNADPLTRSERVKVFLLWGRSSGTCFGGRWVPDFEEEQSSCGPVFPLPYCSECGSGTESENTREEWTKDKYSFVPRWCNFTFLS